MLCKSSKTSKRPQKPSQGDQLIQSEAGLLGGAAWATDRLVSVRFLAPAFKSAQPFCKTVNQLSIQLLIFIKELLYSSQLLFEEASFSSKQCILSINSLHEFNFSVSHHLHQHTISLIRNIPACI